MTKMTGEFKFNVQAPADYVANWILDIRNWGRGEGLAGVFGRGMKIAWEGEPWQIGSVIVMKMGLIKGRFHVVELAPGEVLRYELSHGPPFLKQLISSRQTYTYSVEPLTPSSCELVHRLFTDGAGTKLVPTLKKSSPDSARAWRVIEADWERAGRPMSAPSPPDVRQPQAEVARSNVCARCGTELADDAAFCHSCGSRIGGR